ncbi:MAG: hypothetical protein JNK04_07290, partial [Myxococcales bacterium]|nr:hypothetical protein [Myxococcales bacterium]
MTSRPLLLAVLVSLLAACADDASTTTGGGDSGGSDPSGGGGSGGENAGGSAAHADPTGSRAIAEMAHGRSHHTATLLADGRVIMIGGDGPNDAPIDSVEQFDPETETWSELPSLPEPRSNHTTTLLEDGRLLIVGGARSNQNGSPSPEGVLSTALLYDIATGVVDEVPLGAPRGGHAAFRLADGDVVIAGGSN